MKKKKRTVKALYVHSGVVIRPESDNSLEELKEKLNACGIGASLRVTYDTR